MSHAANPVTTFEELAGRQVAVYPAATYWQYIEEKYNLSGQVQVLNYNGQLADWLLNDDRVTQVYATSEPYYAREQGADPVLLDLLRWHGAEEVEHRCVAFDVYRHLGGGYVSRYYLASIAMPAIFGLWVHGAAHLMNQDERFKAKKPSVFKPWIWMRWMREVKTGHLPSPIWLALKELPFFSPWYDPVKEGSTEEALAYLNNSPAAARAAAAASSA